MKGERTTRKGETKCKSALSGGRKKEGQREGDEGEQRKIYLQFPLEIEPEQDEGKAGRV